MPPAGSLSQAISLTPENVTGAANVDLIDDTLVDFINLIKAIGFDEENAGQRTVSDWLVFLLAAAQFIAAGQSNTIVYIGQATDVVNRTLYATIEAETDFRISSAQSTAMLAAYNATWGTF